MIKAGMNELRKLFLDFFASKDHQIIESFSLIPKDDPSLLLINAGMAPLKPYFTGEVKIPGNRAASSQRCLRTQDIDNVGKTVRHGTFFEMLGNFSFGDYFKEEAISWAWEFLTQVVKMDENRLWVTIYKDDDEAHDIWKDVIGLAEERIVRLGKEDNFWELEVGPCGPCTEIHYDLGEDFGCGKPDCRPGCDCDRYLEVWNLVFSQYIKDEEGNYSPVAHPNIDTGMGLERLAMVVEGANNIFEVGLVKNIISKIEELSGISYGEDYDKDVSIRIIADHTRAISFLIMDGVVPSNEGRGYVLRRLARRAIRHGILLGIEGEFMTKIVQAVMDSYEGSYPALEEDKDRIFKIIKTEEDQFNKTIEEGLERLEVIIDRHKEAGDKTIPGEEVFKLYDTYGFPYELTEEIAGEKGFSLDEKSFKESMAKQKERSRQSREADKGFYSDKKLVSTSPKTSFTGYDKLTGQAKLLEIFVDGRSVSEIEEGQEGALVVDVSPFYAEGGGQVGDRGLISTLKARARVETTKKNADEVFFHMVKVEEGRLEVGDTVVLEVDEELRRATMNNHSATHLLNAALKEVLGDHINQAGSYVSDQGFRFDFTHYEAISKEDLSRIERLVNDYIASSLDVSKVEMPLTEANSMGAIGLFEDKYKDIVRVVSMGDVSMELCGGTHINNTSQIQMFKILSESGISAGVRRIEAITGMGVYDYLLDKEKTISLAAEELSTQEDKILTRIKSLKDDLKAKDKKIETIKKNMRESSVEEVIDSAQEVAGIKYLTHKYDNIDMDSMRKLADQFRDSLGEAVVVLASAGEGKVTLVATVSKGLVEKGLDAGKIIKETAKLVGGGGGGRKDFASAGGRDVDKIDDALASVESIIKEGID